MKDKKNSLGIIIALIALSLIMIGWFMQLYSLFNWEHAVEIGLQNNGFNCSNLEAIKANKERGEAIADILWPLPLSLLSFYGILKHRLFGFIACMMVFSICIYFPLFYLFQMLESNINTAIMAILIWGLPSIAGIIGLWKSRMKFLKA